MDIGNIKALGILEKQILYHAKKQAVITENVASADIPGYERKDVKAPDFSGLVKDAGRTVKLEKTDSNHITPSKKYGGPVFETGDTVKMDMEAIELMKNSTSFAESTQSYKKFLGLIKEATGGSQ